MKLQVLQENLSHALAIASRFASTKAQLPVLANILLSAKKSKLLVSATNLETSISLFVGAKVESGGELTVPSRVVTDLISNLPGGPITLEVKKEQLKITTSGFTSKVSGMNSADFPSVSQQLGKGPLIFPKEKLINALGSVLFATSIDETRPILTGVLFIFKKGELILVATDGFRLSQKRLRLAKLKQQKQNRLILPKGVLSELLRLSSEEEEIGFSWKEGDNQVVFRVPNAILSSRVIEGEFPDFEKIIPETFKIKINLDREELLRAVRLASVFARDAANVVKISVKKDSMLLSAESSQAGSQETQVDAKVEGELGKRDFTVAFNYRFLEDFLGASRGEEIQIEFFDSSSPGVFTNPKDPDFLHLMMPVRIQG